MPVPVIILCIVFMLIAVRQVGNLRLGIWQIMAGGAVAVLITGDISPAKAVHAVNWDVMLFLSGMFVVGMALEESGYLSRLSFLFFRKAHSIDRMILLILFGMGLASAFLMNDTIAIIGTPVVLLLARQHQVNPKIMLLSLAFAITTGSVMSPIGNPQNLLIAIEGEMKNPFLDFFSYLLVPTLLNLYLTFLILKLLFREEFRRERFAHLEAQITDPRLAGITKVSLILMLGLILLKILTVFLGNGSGFRLTWIALITAAPILLFSRKRIILLSRLDWSTLAFFAAMFVLMHSVWDTGFFQNLITVMDINLTSLFIIMVLGVVLSQFISNVPMVALFLPLMLETGAGTAEMMALAAGSTLAGNLLILGAASNIIIIQNAEKKSGIKIKFQEFAKVGIPVTMINLLIFCLYLVLF